MNYLDKEEVNSKCWQTSCQLDVLDFGVDLGGPHQLLVLHEDLLLDLVGPDVGLRQELLQTVEERKSCCNVAAAHLTDEN